MISMKRSKILFYFIFVWLNQENIIKKRNVNRVPEIIQEVYRGRLKTPPKGKRGNKKQDPPLRAQSINKKKSIIQRGPKTMKKTQANPIDYKEKSVSTLKQNALAFLMIYHFFLSKLSKINIKE